MLNTPLTEKRILLGVSGSIACYKAAELASRLAQAGAQVDIVLTQAASRFITPLTFQAVTGRKAYLDADLWGQEAHVLHVGLGESANLVVVAPATANTLAKLAHGLADSLLTLAALAATCPLVIAPAMDGDMYQHPATQANLETLRARGAHILGPAKGHLASGQEGFGRMLEPTEILGQLRLILARQGPLAGKRVLVTAGGTQEPLDPVRVIANRSSGKQGYALAQAALDYGAEVTLISAPTCLETPPGAVRVEVRTAQEMQAAVLERLPETDVLLMAAAVADYRPAAVDHQKIKRSSAGLQISLEAIPDILGAVAEAKTRLGKPVVTVGFAAESQDLIANARQKLAAKQLNMIAANDITAQDAGFGSDDNRVTLLDQSGGVEQLPLASKTEVAGQILARVTQLFREASQ